MCIYVCLCMHIFVYMYLFVYMYIGLCMYVCMYIFVCGGGLYDIFYTHINKKFEEIEMSDPFTPKLTIFLVISK